MTVKMTEEEKQARIREEMEVNKVSEAEARFRVSIEAGDIPGDVLEVDGIEDDPDAA